MNYHREQRRLKRIAAKQAANYVPPPRKPSNRYERMMARRTPASQ